MSLEPSLLETLCHSNAKECWAALGQKAWQIFAEPLETDAVAGQLAARERALHWLDLFLSNSVWDLWQELETGMVGNAQAVTDWWTAGPPGRAVLILDGLSLREVPWLLQQAPSRGFRVVRTEVTRAELPPDTNYFARALGLPGRAALENDQAGKHNLAGAHTQTTDLPFQDCISWVGSQPDWLFWHHWPDHRLHELDNPGKGLASLAQEAAHKLCDKAFWDLLERLCQGRRLLLTSDHGYAAAGFFEDAETAQAAHLKELFKSGRHSQHSLGPSPFLPPTDLTLSTRWGQHRFALGQRRWKSQGGYPTLTHGGLTLLEVLCPFIELERI